MVISGRKIYYHNAPQYFTRFTDFTPYFRNAAEEIVISSHVKTIIADNAEEAAVITAALNSSLFYWYNTACSNCRDLTFREIESFPIGVKRMSKRIQKKLLSANKRLMKDFQHHAKRKTSIYRATGKVEYDEYYPKYSKPIIDEIDAVLAEHYGFTAEELDYIVNYDIKYRMGDELEGN